MQTDKETLCKQLDSVVVAFLTEWKINSTHWLQEIDIQVDLGARIRAIVKEFGRSTIHARHRLYGKGKYEFFRVACEPYVILGNELRSVHPDIVVWDDDDADTCTLDNGSWPVLWACEIKYTFTMPDDSDIQRLQTLLAPREKMAATSRGCALVLVQDPVRPDYPGDRDCWEGPVHVIQAHA